MLDTHLKRKVEAEKLYRKCVRVEMKHAYALYNLAVLLEEKFNELENTKNNTTSSSNLHVTTDSDKTIRLDEVTCHSVLC